MSIIKFSGTGVTAISGKQGGTVFAAAGSAGPFARNWVKNVNPKTARQSLVRNTFSAFMSNFGNLSDSQITAWNTAAATNTANSLRVNSFGDARNMSGQQLYQRINHLCFAAGLTHCADVPTQAVNTTLTLDSLSINAAGPTLTAFLNDPSGVPPLIVPANTYIFLYATPQYSPGRSVFPDNMYRLIEVFNPTDANPLNFLATYTPIFGTLIAGHIISAAVKIMTVTTGGGGSIITWGVKGNRGSKMSASKRY